MSKDNNKGTPAGFIFQFEIALLELSKCETGEIISLEKVDDVAKEAKSGNYTCTIQVKHSIKSSITNFGNTSVDLWKTINIWINKLLNKTVDKNNKFIAITNKKRPKDSILYLDSFNLFLDSIIVIYEKQKLEYSTKIAKNPKSGSSIKATIDRIDFAIKNKCELEIIFNNLEIIENINVKEEFINNIFLSTKNQEIKDRVFNEFLGWIQDTSKEKWKNNKEAEISKSEFDFRYNLIRDNTTIINSLFRHKKEIYINNNIDYNNRDEIYIKQIDDLERFEKEKIIKDAILDFVYCNVEITRLIINKDGNTLTKTDYEEFEETCEKAWSYAKRKHIHNDLSKYSNDELNLIGCKIYDEIIYNLELKFKDYLDFNVSTKYIQNGTFFRLSNLLKIGWSPNWEEKYK